MDARKMLLLSALVFFTSGAAFGHGRDTVAYRVEASGGASTGRHAPLWVTANRFGLSFTDAAGGYLRAMRCVPIFRGFAAKIRECCPHAWVINYTNPMTLCVRTLFEEFPEIKLFGCCHEVFGTQKVLKAMLH